MRLNHVVFLFAAAARAKRPFQDECKVRSECKTNNMSFQRTGYRVARFTI